MHFEAEVKDFAKKICYTDVYLCGSVQFTPYSGHFHGKLKKIQAIEFSSLLKIKLI